MSRHVLILAGTPEARSLAASIARMPGWRSTSSFAGLTARLVPTPGEVRAGGFGGRQGLQSYLVSEGIDAIINAVHPYATRISHSAWLASQALNLPYLRFLRPPWHAAAGDRWIQVPDLEAAVRLLPAGVRTLVTTGRAWRACLDRTDVTFFVRLMTPPESPPARNIRFLKFQPGAMPEDEADLLSRLRIDLLISKNAGGESGKAKIYAARNHNLPVLMIDRPASNCSNPVIAEAEAINWLERLVR